MKHPTLTFTDTGVPKSEAYSDYYFSLKGPVEERRYVFLEGSNLPERWLHKRSYTIAETGFGTGLSFLLTWQLWAKTKNNGEKLDYYAFEKHPLNLEDWQKVGNLWPQYTSEHQHLIEACKTLGNGWNKLQIQNNITLHLYIGDALTGLDTLSQKIDCWYLDGFDPAKNPDMWSDQLFEKVAAHTNKNGSFATFTAISRLQRKMKELGFDVHKREGFGGKREMLFGHKL